LRRLAVLNQIVAVTALNLKGIRQRLVASSVIVAGIASVVGVLVSVLTMAGSLSGTLLAAGHAERAIVLRAGANAEIASTLPVDAAATIASAPGVARAASGDPAATADILVPVNFTRRSDGSVAPLSVRGVSDLHGVRPEVELVEGRLFEPGLRELIVGRNAQRAFAGLELGDRVALRDSEWTVVGVYRSGDVAESGMITDAATLQSAYKRAVVNSVTVRLESAGSFDAFETALTTNPSLSVDVFREPEYFALQAEDLSALFFFVTYIVTGIMAAGALVGAINTMYSAVSTRRLEIATLRAIGFGASGVVVSVLAEAVLLALLGACAGAAVSWLLFSGDTISLGGGQGSLVTELAITPATLVTGVVWAVTAGFLGGLFPALRAARLPVATALRAT
jgi:putative ABC transport system permease protein